MNAQEILTGLSNATWIIGGAVAILGVFILGAGGLVWLWLTLGKLLSKYIRKASGEFREAFREVNGGKVVKMREK